MIVSETSKHEKHRGCLRERFLAGEAAPHSQESLCWRVVEKRRSEHRNIVIHPDAREEILKVRLQSDHKLCAEEEEKKRAHEVKPAARNRGKANDEFALCLDFWRVRRFSRRHKPGPSFMIVSTR